MTINDDELNALVKRHESFMNKGEYYHRLTLLDDSAVVSSSVINETVAKWNAMIRLMCLIENGRIDPRKLIDG